MHVTHGACVWPLYLSVSVPICLCLFLCLSLSLSLPPSSLSISPSYLGEGRVRCPWHGACFNVTTGDIEDYPGIDSLARYTVKIKGEDIIVSASKKVIISTGLHACIHVHTLLYNYKYFLSTYLTIIAGHNYL